VTAARSAVAAIAGVVVAGCAMAVPTVSAPATEAPTAQTSTAASATAFSTVPPSLTPSPSPPPLTDQGLREAVEVADIRVHLEALQRIADEHGGNRATGTAGFDATVAYVEERLVAAGYEVEQQLFIVGDASSASLMVEAGPADEEVVMFGAHLDSVAAGPGINDNGSGVATLLVVSERLAEMPPPERTIRFAFWGAEENGPFGSAAYVDQLADDDRAGIRAYLNFDMLGSPNFVRFVYAEARAASGSEALTDLFADYFEGAGLAWEPIDLQGDTDHGPFIAAGIPTGGLFSGGIEPKTDRQAAAFGGTAGVSADVCSHAACDTITNVSDVALDEMADAVAHAVATLAAEEP
jgi:aminopeptidase S